MERRPVRAQLINYAKNEYGMVAVSDGGHGITADVLDRVFEPPGSGHETILLLDELVGGCQLANKAQESGYTESAIVQQGWLDPGVALLSKTYLELAQRIRTVLAGPVEVPS